MKRIKQNYDVEVSEIRNFLIDSGWALSRQTSNLSFYSPPEDLRIKGGYTLALPNDDSLSGVDAFMVQAVAALEDIYGIRFYRVKDKLASKSELEGAAQFNVRFLDEQTTDGSMSLGSLKTFLEQMQKGLYEGAKFKLDGSAHGPSNSMAAKFVKDCRFLQTKEGSFIARIEVPFGWLHQGDLFWSEAISSHEVCSSIQSSIQFITERILKSDEAFGSDTALSEAISLFDPELLETLAKMLIGPEIEQLEIVMEIGNQRRVSTTGIIDSARKSRLLSYVDFIKNHFYGEDGIDVSGSIVELRSRDPHGNRNHIRIMADYFGDKTYISATLTNEQYVLAVDAHRNKWNVRIRGGGIRLKTQIRLDTVVSFDVVN